MTRNSNTIIAQLTGSRTCAAEGITIFGSSPVLKVCRALIEAGYDASCRLEVYRRGKLSFVVRSIGEGSVLRVTERRDGRPIFAPWRDAACTHSDSNPETVPDTEKISAAA